MSFFSPFFMMTNKVECDFFPFIPTLFHLKENYHKWNSNSFFFKKDFTAEIGVAERTLTELRRMVQSLEIDLDSMRNLKVSLENSLKQVEMHYAMQVEQFNWILLHLESELAQTRAEGKCQAQEIEVLLSIKVKLEAEIATYRSPLEEGEDFNLVDALDKSPSLQTIQKTMTCRTVDGRVMSEVNDTKVLRH